MDELKSKRHPFQFSLPKLLLWSAVWSVYLNIVRWAGMPLPASSIVTVCLAALLAIRIRWGLNQGLPFAVYLMAGIAFALAWFGVLPSDDVGALFFMLATCLLGAVFGFYGFLIVCSVVRAVDWLDSLMAAKPPQGQ